MSVRPADFRPRPDEDAVQHPELRMLVEAARAQTTPAVGVDADALHAAWTQRRARRRLAVGGGLAAVAAAILLTVAVRPWADPPGPGASPRPSDDPGAMADANPVTPPVEAAPVPSTAGPSTPGPSTTDQPPRPPTPRLAARVEVSALDGAPGSAEILGPHRLRLPPGRWSIRSEASEAVEVIVPGETLELRGGHVHVLVAADGAQVEVLDGEVVRHEASDRAGSTETGPEATGPETTTPSRRAPADADALARDAEAHMAAGHRGEAIKTLRRLVTQHPRSAAARSGLLDLGRLLERAGHRSMNSA